jgi:hypothetical protein
MTNQTDYFVDADKADDSGDGYPAMANAKKHLYAVIALLESPITSNITIHLKADTTDPYVGDTTIFGLNCVGSARLYIQTEVWNDNNYDSGQYDPFDADNNEGTFDLDGTKHVDIQHLIAVEACNFLELRGLGFTGESGVAIAGVLVLPGAKVKAKYCRFDDANAKAVGAGGQLDLENNYYYENMVAVVSAGQGRVDLLGDNLIEDPLMQGIHAVGRSRVHIAPWLLHPKTSYQTEIRTNQPPAKDFVAVSLKMDSLLSVQEPDLYAWEVNAAKLAIRNLNKTLTKAYRGVVLGSRSMVTGADQIECTTLDANGDTVPIPSGQAIVENEEEGTATFD